MVKLRSQEDDPVPQWFSRFQEATDQRFSRFQEATDQWLSRLEAMVDDLLCRSRKGKKENPEDQICNYEELAEIEAETKSSGIEDRAVENEANSKVISAIVKEKSTPQVQVPIANSEILMSIELGKVDLGLENEEYVVLNENLEQEWDQMNVNEKLEVDGDVERGQKMIIDTQTFCAHKVFVKMPSKEKRMKHLKAWKFKFKSTSKRRRLMDDMFSFVEETALLKKDPKETIWDCVKKEFFSIDFTPMELKVKLASNHFEGQLLRQFQELFEKLSLASMMFEQTFSSITEPKKILPSFFRLKHKWRSRLSHSFSEIKQRMIGKVWESFGYLMEDMMEEDQKQQGDSEPLVIVPDFDAKVCVTFDQCIRKRLFVSADRGTKNNKPTLRVLMDTKQCRLSLQAIRVWDPGGSNSETD